jgi:hypothetical protein
MVIIVLYRSHCTSLHIHCTGWDGAGASFKRSGGRSGVPGQNRLGPRSAHARAQLAGGGGRQSPSAWAGLLGHAGPGDSGVRGRAGWRAGWRAGGCRRVARAAAWALVRAGGPGMRASVRARRRGTACPPVAGAQARPATA